MFQQEVEELFFFETGAFIVTYVTSWWEVIGCLQNPGANQFFYSDLPFAYILCPAVPFKTAPALECFLPNISSTCMLPHPQSVAEDWHLVAHCLPCRENARLRSSAFPNQTDNLSLRCFNRKSKNYSFSSQTGAFRCYVMVGGDRWCAFKSYYSHMPLACRYPTVPLEHCTST